MSIAIKAENLSKNYLIGHQGKKLQGNFSGNIKHRILHPFKSLRPKTETELFWALQDINFEIAHGQRVGIIGSNGAGKSTLLKILSRITPPSTGKVTLNGRVSSLLEVGTGFHPELSGRENIFMNGAILGMSRNEIKRKFDAIVDFSEVEKFLDTPVKRYSSGMYVRLAFAVAAHLEPEILIVDEVLAVGDTAFQKKCLGKMSEVSSTGRTVLFVSHNLNAIQQLCDSAIYLKQGRVVDQVHGVDQVEELVRQYYSSTTSHGMAHWTASDKSLVNPWFSPTAMYASDIRGNVLKGSIRNDEVLLITIEGDIQNPSQELALGFVVFDEYGSAVFASKITDTTIENWPRLKTGHNRLHCQIHPRFFNEGRYSFKLVGNIVGGKNWLFKPRETTVGIEVNFQGGLSDSPHWVRKRLGVVAPVFQWHSTEDNA